MASLCGMKLSRIFLTCLLTAPLLCAQTPPPKQSTAQLNQWLAVRQQRVGLLRSEIEEMDGHFESRVDLLVETLVKINDSKDSRTKVARMKEETQNKLLETVKYYEQKRAALKEELRNPRTHLTAAEKQQAMGTFDARIEKRVKQILALSKSMPQHKDYERYRATGGGWWGTQYERNQDYEQNRRITSHVNQQRKAIAKELDSSIARLDQQLRTLKTQAARATAEQQQLLNQEIARTETMIANRRQQKLELHQSSDFAARSVNLKEAAELDRSLQREIAALKSDLTTLFQRYHEFISELSYQHATEAAIARTERG